MKLAPEAHGLVLATVGTLILTPDTLLIRMIGTDHWTLLFWRGLLMFAALLAYRVVRHREQFAARIRAGLHVTFPAGMLFGFSTVLFVSSLSFTTVANTLVILAASPLVSAFMARLFLGETVSRGTWLAAVFGLAGVAIIVGGGIQAGSILGDLMALGSAISIATTLTLFRKHELVDTAPGLLFGAAFSCLAGLVMGSLGGGLAISGYQFSLFAVLGFFVLPVSFVMITKAAAYIPAPEIGLVMLLETVFGPYWVWLVVDETPSLPTMIGGTVILGTITIHSLASLHALRRRFPV